MLRYVAIFGAESRVFFVSDVGVGLVLGGRKQVAARVGRGALVGRLEVLVLAQLDHVRPVFDIVGETFFYE